MRSNCRISLNRLRTFFLPSSLSIHARPRLLNPPSIRGLRCLNFSALVGDSFRLKKAYKEVCSLSPSKATLSINKKLSYSCVMVNRLLNLHYCIIIHFPTDNQSQWRTCGNAFLGIRQLGGGNVGSSCFHAVQPCHADHYRLGCSI